jgi:hypothetical protein
LILAGFKLRASGLRFSQFCALGKYISGGGGGSGVVFFFWAKRESGKNRRSKSHFFILDFLKMKDFFAILR